MEAQKQFETQAHVMQASNAIRDSLNNFNSWIKEMKQKEKERKSTTIEVSFIKITNFVFELNILKRLFFHFA